MSRQGTVWTPPRPSGTETTQKEREFQEAARPAGFDSILSVQGCGQGGRASRDQTPTQGSRAAGTEHRHKEPLAPGARAGGARSPGQQGSHLLGPHTRCVGFTRTRGRGSCGGTRRGDPTAGLKPTQPRERSLHAGHVARPAQGPCSPGRGTPTPTEVVPQRPEEVGGAARPLRNMMGWGQRPEGSARPGCWRHRAGQGLRTRPGWTGGSGRRTQGRDGHSAGDKEVTWGCRVLSRLPEPA